MIAHSCYELNVEANNLMQELYHSLYHSLHELLKLHYQILSNQQERLEKFTN